MNKEFIMENVFHKVELKRIRKTFDKAKDISKERTDEFNLPLINAKNGDNGIMYYGRLEDWESDIYCIDIINDGAVSTGNVYAQPQRTGVLYNAYMIKPNKTIESEEILLFLAKTIEKAIKHRFGYDNKATWDKVKVMPISLPVIENSNPDHEYTVDDINWQYMRDRITELERDRITELDAYLQAARLKDCELTEGDKKLLSTKATEKEFVMHDVFEKLKAPYKGQGKKQDNVSKIPTEEFNLPLINCKYNNNGIMYYGRKSDYTYYENVFSVIYNGPPTEGQTYFQEEIGVYTDAYLITLKDKSVRVNREIGLYLTSVINASIHNEKQRKYSRGNKATWEDKVENDIIILPVTSSGEPDYDYMERYIRAIEKVVIADVVKYKDKVIETTKKVASE